MNPHVGAPSWTARATACAAEAICALPAVPTPDWCERAAGALLQGVHRPAIVLVMFTGATSAGQIEAVECIGVAGRSVAEVGTTVSGVSAVQASVPLGPTHPAIGRIRSAAHGCTALGWSPARPGPEGLRAVAASGLPDPGVVRARWADTGAAELIVGAAALAGDRGRYLITEIGLTDPHGSTEADHGCGDETTMLDAVLPALARQAGTAFGPEPYSEAACLTRREEQVLEHLLSGRSVKQIAERLERSQHTVHDHVKALHRKLAASSRGALIARALGYNGRKHGLSPGHAAHN